MVRTGSPARAASSSTGQTGPSTPTLMPSTVPANTVTVITVTMIPESIARLMDTLRAEPGFEHAELADTPQPLTGGFWASMSLLRLAGVAPPGDALVLRVIPDPAFAAKETVFQREVAAQGLPVPAIRLAGGAGGLLDDAFILMDRAPGRMPLEGLGGVGAIRRLPFLARRLPDVLGQAAAALHALDPAPVQAALASADVDAPH